MRPFVSIVAAASLALLLSACATMGKPRTDTTSSTGYYIPSDLDDAMVELDRIMGRKGRAEVIKATESAMLDYHFGLGTWLRNNWLRGESRLADYFRQRGISHRDDMSGIIFDSYWRKLHNQPIDLEGQIRHYQE